MKIRSKGNQVELVKTFQKQMSIKTKNFVYICGFSEQIKISLFFASFYLK